MPPLPLGLGAKGNGGTSLVEGSAMATASTSILDLPDEVLARVFLLLGELDDNRIYGRRCPVFGIPLFLHDAKLILGFLPRVCSVRAIR